MAPEGRVSLNTTTSITSSQLRDENGIRSLRYEETMEGKPPISVTVPPPRAPPVEQHPALRNPSTLSAEQDSEKRDSALAPQTSSTTATSLKKEVSNNHVATNKASQNSFSPSPTTATAPSINATNAMGKNEDGSQTPASTDSSTNCRSPKVMIPRITPSASSTDSRKDKNKSPTSPTSATTDEAFSHIDTQIPDPSLLETEFFQDMAFSKRGSMLWGAKKAATSAQARSNPSATRVSMMTASTPVVLSSEAQEESQKVRSMYESADATSMNWRDGRASVVGDVEPEEQAHGTGNSQRDISSPTSTTQYSIRGSTIKREHELAGGLEDWEDVDGEDVDRYGFISIRDHDDPRPGTPEPRPPQRVSTVLQLASDAPRQQRRILARQPSSRSARSAPRRTASRQVSGRSLRTIASDADSNRRNLSAFRVAVNRLPGNQSKRWMDEAGDMLTLPPGLAEIADNQEGGKAAEAMKAKEWERTEKWRKMAKQVKNGKEGEGMVFEFDVKSSKVIERTWKGIPDRWRGSAWFSFLSASAKKNKDSATDDELIQAFHHLIEQGSADDVQIDVDVPRTINSHIMFRRRYRGGQRLLFRVLHCLSLYFPVIGYVQGMASLAATLLCYYDEEKTFIMLVRMWQLRGLEKLYAHGFGGLLSALEEFQTHWMAGNDVSKKLTELSIDTTAYGTRWYLTLFNYSIPFPAQLRVWDVFMLLGDADPAVITPERPFGGCLDVIHAVGSALLEGTREILLDSDFENAMKVVTSWIPVKDEELLMNITKVKYSKQHGKRSRARTLVSKTSIPKAATA